MIVSTLNSQLTLEYLQTKVENQYFERKGVGSKDTSPTRIANELIGMLNADGGVLALGVSDSGIIAGLNSVAADKLSDYRNLIHDYIEPFGNIELEEVEIASNLVFLYHVEQDLERIYKRKDNEKIYLRIDDRNKELDRDAVRKLEYDKQIRRFEDEIVPAFNFDDLDHKLLERYKVKLNFAGEPLDLLVKRHLAVKKDNQYQIKNAGVLLFSKEPEKYIPSASLRYVRYEGTVQDVGSAHNVVKDERFEENIPWIIQKVKELLKISLRDYYFLDLEKGVFTKVPEYPEEAWLEGIVNALCHRSYNIQGNTIDIKHFDDRLEISNSGPLPAQVNVDNIREERFSRNPRIARALEDMGFVRQLNEGVSRIYKSMEESMLSIPEYLVKNRNVYLTLRNKVSKHTKTITDSTIKHIQKNWSKYNVTQRGILEFMLYNHQATVSELAIYTGINEKTVRNYLNGFIEGDQIVVRLSDKRRDKHAKYTFKKS